MSATHPADKRIYARQHYASNKEGRKSARDKALTRARKFLRGKKNNPCMDCGHRFHWFVMDFDHRDPCSKTITPSMMIGAGWSLQRMQDELDMCDLVCANCHRLRTASQMGFIEGKELSLPLDTGPDVL